MQMQSSAFRSSILGAIAAFALAFCSGNLLASPEPVVVPPTDFPRPATPPLGVNLEFVCDYARSLMFVDTIKSARRFGSADAPWDEKALVGPDGWPTGDAGLVVMADTPVPAGDYNFSCTGTCTISTPSMASEVRGLSYDRKTNTTTAVLNIPTETTHLFLSFRNTHGGIKNIRLLLPGYPLNTTQVFSKPFLDAIKPFSTLRFMDATRTNSTSVSTWEQRPKVTDALQSTPNGIAWEYAIELANVTGKDLWLNVPDRADDSYVHQFAKLLKEKLKPDRNVYLEYSNEVWNTIFPQSGHNFDDAKKAVAAGDKTLNDDGKDNNQYYWAWKRVGQRLVQISNIFRQEWGDAAINTRIRPVLASQSANPFMTRMQVKYIVDHIGPPGNFIYGIAGAPYLGPGDEFNGRDNITLDDVFHTGFPHGFPWVKDVAHQYSVIAHYHRLRSLCYEAATSLEGDHSLDVKIAANHDPRIGTVIHRYLNFWYADGGDLLMYYGLSGTYSKYGCWGLTDDIRKSTPKIKAMGEIAAAPMPPLEDGFVIPGNFSAAKFDATEGGKAENGPDGIQNVGFLHDGCTLDYLVLVKEPGTYSLQLQTASAQDGAVLEPLFSGTSLGNVACPNTGEWQKYSTTAPVLMKLSPGQLVLRLHVVHGSMNIRSITINKEG